MDKKNNTKTLQQPFIHKQRSQFVDNQQKLSTKVDESQIRKVFTTKIDENNERLLLTESCPSSLNESNITNFGYKSPAQLSNCKKIDINSLAEQSESREYIWQQLVKENVSKNNGLNLKLVNALPTDCIIKWLIKEGIAIDAEKANAVILTYIG